MNNSTKNIKTEYNKQDEWLEYEKAKETILPYLSNVKFDIKIPNYNNINKNKPNLEVETIFNLDIKNSYYLSFLKFMKKELEIVYNEYKLNKGNIVTYHVFDEFELDSQEYKDATRILADLQKEYEAIYVTDLDKSTNKFKTETNQLYPYFQKDMMSKSRRIQFEKIEKKMGINLDTNGLQEQSPIEFLDTMIKRIEKLFSCYKTKETKENKEYYKNELIREINQLKKILNNTTDNITDNIHFFQELETTKLNTNINSWESINTDTPTIQSWILDIKTQIAKIKEEKNEPRAKEIVKEHCKTILWGPNDSNYNKDINTNDSKKEKYLEEFRTFIVNNPKELLFLKTFMIECFYKDEKDNTNYTNTIDWTKVKEKMGNRTFRQMFFGFYYNLEKYKDYKSFYEVMGSNSIVKTKVPDDCFLVIWTLFLNYYFNMCSGTNTDIDIPIRFKLPTNYRQIIIDNKKDDYSKYKYEFRLPSQTSHNKNVFEKKDMKFIGFINIKFYHENNNDSKEANILSGTFRNWKLFVFKSTFKNDIYTDYMDGDITNTPILNHKLQLVYKGSLFARDPVTYEELKFFKKKSENKELFIYATLLDNETLFISSKENLQDINYLKDLKLKPIHLKLSEKNEMTHIMERYLTLIPNNKKNNHLIGGTMKLNIDLKFTNKINMYNDDLNDNKVHSNYYKDVIKVYFIEEKKGVEYIYKYSKTIYKYLLISSNDLIYLYKNIYKQTNNLILKYNPISAPFLLLLLAFMDERNMSMVTQSIPPSSSIFIQKQKTYPIPKLYPYF